MSSGQHNPMVLIRIWLSKTASAIKLIQWKCPNGLFTLKNSGIHLCYTEVGQSSVKHIHALQDRNWLCRGLIRKQKIEYDVCSGFWESMQIDEVRCKRSMQVEKATWEHLHMCQVIMLERHHVLKELCDDGCPSANRFLHPNEHSRYLAYVDFLCFHMWANYTLIFLLPSLGWAIRKAWYSESSCDAMAFPDHDCMKYWMSCWGPLVNPD